jgi:hypothetical protein
MKMLDLILFIIGSVALTGLKENAIVVAYHC